MRKRVLSALAVDVLLALAVGWAVVALATDLRAPIDVPVGVGLGCLVLAVPVVELVARQGRLTTVRVPGRPDSRRRLSPRTTRFGIGAVVLSAVVLLSLGAHLAALILVLAALLALIAVLASGMLTLRQRPRRRAELTAALVEYQPRFVVYTARRNDASYQLSMWLPELDKLELPYLVVVRHPSAVDYARNLTNAPIVCCPAGPDLDALMVPSLRAAFYVNGVAENAGFAAYRQLCHVYLGHGDSDKEQSVHPMHAMFDRILVAGQAAIDRYQLADVAIEAEKFVVVGRPQLAGLRGAEPPSNPVSTTAPADRDAETGRPRVLVAPTWRGYNAVTTLSSLPVTTVVVQELIAADAVVSFRPHPFSWLGAEREHIDAVDALLRADRTSHGRPHRLAAENRGVDLVDNLADSDALVSDVGSVLVDYFVTGKPYATVLPADSEPATAQQRYPSTSASYLITRRELDAPSVNGHRPHWVIDLLIGDPLAARRAAVCQRYLGPQPGDDAPFLAAARRVIIEGRGRTASRDTSAEPA